MRHTIIRTALTLLMIALAFRPALSAEDKAAPEAPKPVVVATVNDEDITRDRLDVAINNLMPVTSFHQAISDERYEALKKKALEGIIDDILFEAEAKKEGIKVTNDEVRREVVKIQERAPAGTSLRAVLKQSNMTMEDFKADIRRGFFVSKLKAKKEEEFRLAASSAITDEYMQGYYSANLDKFKEPEKVKLSEILIKADPSAGSKEWKAAFDRAKEISDKARSGEDFAELARGHSESKSAAKGGDVGWAHSGSLVPEMEAAIDSLEVDQVSEPVMTLYGYSIIKLEERSPEALKKFEDLNQEKLKKELEEKEFQRLREEWRTGLRSKATIMYHEEAK